MVQELQGKVLQEAGMFEISNKIYTVENSVETETGKIQREKTLKAILA